MTRKQCYQLLFRGLISVIVLYNFLLPFISKTKSKENSDVIKEIVIMCATNKTNLRVIHMDYMERLVSSLLRESPTEIININIITYEKQVNAIKEILKRTLRKNETITYEFISLDIIQQNFPNFITLSQNYTASHRQSKFYDITFHVRALYPRIFKHQKVIVIDVDVEFRSPLSELYIQFEHMNSYQIIAMAYDQTPYYRKALKKYRSKLKGTDTGIRTPGNHGLNTGVILFDLDKMRRNKEYNYHLTDTGYIYLFEKYNMVSTLGDQDFFTLLEAEYPKLFYILDCSFNRQMSPLFFSDPLFYKYHRCDNKVKIYHGNGRSIIPSRDEDP